MIELTDSILRTSLSWPAMSRRKSRHFGSCFLLAALFCGQLAAQETPVVDAVLADDSLGDFWLAQAEPGEAPEPPSRPVVRSPRRRSTSAARRRLSTYRSPSMFGDYFGGLAI